MSAAAEICFASRDAKRRDFPREVLPNMRKAVRNALRDPGEKQALVTWLESNQVLEHQGYALLKALHDAARSGAYVPTRRSHCDVVRLEHPVTTTLARGGDCDQWAVVIAAALKLLGLSPRLFGFGDSDDPWEHVAVGAKFGRGWFLLDAKGSQRGLHFNEWPGEPLQEARL